jgi:ADP-heptose:LPS heptosyltransferase
VVWGFLCLTSGTVPRVSVGTSDLVGSILFLTFVIEIAYDISMQLGYPRIFLGRSAMLGDILSQVVVATYLKKLYPTSHLIWALGKKSAQSAMLYFKHKVIDEIYITDGDEDLLSEEDFTKFSSCQIKFSMNPQHSIWSNYPHFGTIYSESFFMNGFSLEQWNSLTDEEKIPKLTKWWNPVRRPFGDKKTILFTGMPNYGRESKRWISKKYLEELVLKLVESSYCVIQSGGEQDESWFSSWDISEGFPVDSTNYKRINERCFFEQVQIANEVDCIVGSDSGMSLILGAYGLPQVSLIPIHWGNHNNPTALSTNNPNNYSFYSFNGTDDISQDSVLDKIKEKLQNKV